MRMTSVNVLDYPGDKKKKKGIDMVGLIVSLSLDTQKTGTMNFTSKKPYTL